MVADPAVCCGRLLCTPVGCEVVAFPSFACGVAAGSPGDDVVPLVVVS